MMDKREMILRDIAGWKKIILQEKIDNRPDIPSFSSWAEERIRQLEQELAMLDELEKLSLPEDKYDVRQ